MRQLSEELSDQAAPLSSFNWKPVHIDSLYQFMGRLILCPQADDIYFATAVQ